MEHAVMELKYMEMMEYAIIYIKLPVVLGWEIDL